MDFHLNITQDVGHGVTVIFICCIFIIAAVLFDLHTGIAAARKNHEAIHSEQQEEIVCASALVAIALCNFCASWWYLLIVLAMPIALYVLAWLLELALPPYDSAYKDSPFEREAYTN